MADPRLAPVLRHLRSLAAPAAGGEPADAVLLERLALRRDQTAFEELVRRHAPLVWRVCRRLLPETGRAEDAFQATLLLLWQRAGSVRKAASLASWLHGVAYRVARRAGADLRRHGAGGGQTRDRAGPAPDPAQEAAWRELGEIIEEELNRLPEKYRLALLLTYWRGLTNEQAARDLGCPPGTLKARLSRARELLHARLTARGVTLPAGAVSLLLSPSGGEAGIPAGLVAAVTGEAETGGAVAAQVSALARQALPAAGLGRAKLALALALALGAVAVGVGVPGQPSVEVSPASRAAGRPKAEALRAGTDRHGDPLPPGAIARLGTVRFRGVRGCLAFAPDGKYLAAAAEPAGAEIALYETDTGRAVRQFAARATLTRLTFAPDGKRIACSDGSAGSQVFDTASGKELFAAQGSHAAFADGGKSLVTVDTYGLAPEVRVWDAATGRPLRQWLIAKARDKDNPFGQGAEEMAVASAGRVLALTDRGAPSVVQIRDLTTGATTRSIRLTGAGRHWLALAPDGKTLATASGTSVRLWDTATGKEDANWAQRSDSRPVFSADGKRLAWTGYDERAGIARLWTVARGDAASRAVGDPVNHFEPPSFSPDGKVLAVVTDAHAVVLRETTTGKDVRPLAAHERTVFSLAFTADGRQVVSRAGTGFIVWEALTGRLLRRFPEEEDGERVTALLSDGRVLTESRQARLYRVLDPLTGREALRITGRPDVGQVALAPGARYVGLSGGQDGAYSVFDLRTGRVRCRLDPREPHFGPKLSADGSILVWHHKKATGFDVRVRRQATGQTLAVAGVPAGDEVGRWLAYRPCVSPDGRWLVLPGGEGRLRRWDLLTGKETTPLTAAQRTVWEILWSPDGQLVLASGTAAQPGVIDREARRDVRAWDAATGKRLPHLDLASVPAAMCFAPDGRTLVTADREDIRLREVATGKERLRLSGHLPSWVGALSVSPDGRLLASGGDDSQVLVWDLTGRSPDGRWRTGPQPPQGREAAWQTLAGADARAAYQALWRLASDPEGTTAWLRQQLKPAPTADRGQLDRLIAELGSGKFTVRDRASGELTRLGEMAEPALRQALAGNPPEEIRRRLLKLLDGLEGIPTGERLRQTRAVEVLEWVGTPEARRELERLAEGAPAARLTRAARASLERLAR